LRDHLLRARAGDDDVPLDRQDIHIRDVSQDVQVDISYTRNVVLLPGVYSRPWTIEMPLYRVIEDNAQVMEHKCVPFADKLLYSDLLHLQPPPKNPGAKK